ncbi:MAG: TrmB family transcriptional regulator [Kangiellaceae bacterium]|nr:TrmB family transcriptional regulator [Kangiellaceae bacterium]|tara:strand:- start:10927 stop:11316 length:390 start_codon:yes stop_codon:yes gene_type:complete
MHLGELEKLVLNYLWSHESADAKQVFEHFEQHRGGSLNTIQAALDRLFKKGLLNRTKKSHAYIYYSAIERSKLLGSLITDITNELAKNDADSILEAFVDVSTALDEESLLRLEQLIDKKKLSIKNGNGA